MSWFPGENLLVKMWDTLIKEGVGGYLEPWQIKRTEAAQAEAKANQMRTIAQAEVDVENIRNGIYKNSNQKLLENKHVESVGEIAKIEPDIDYKRFEEISTLLNEQRELKENINITMAVFEAEEKLMFSDKKANDETVDSDWVQSWRDKAKRVSTKEMQMLWGRVLAGEITQPGSFSLRTLELLKTLTKTDAELIIKIAPFVFDESKIIKDGLIEKFGITFDDLFHLEELGILSSIDSVGRTITYASVKTDSFHGWIYMGEHYIFMNKNDASARLTLDVYAVTKLGSEILSICEFEPNLDALNHVASQMKSKGFDISSSKIIIVDGDEHFDEDKIVIH